jgi:hypothetical protein
LSKGSDDPKNAAGAIEFGNPGARPGIRQKARVDLAQLSESPEARLQRLKIRRSLLLIEMLLEIVRCHG